MKNSKLKKVKRAGSIAALALMIAVPSFAYDTALIQAYATTQNIVEDEQSNESDNAHGGNHYDDIADGSIHEPIDESIIEQPKLDQVEEDSEADLQTVLVDPTVIISKPLFNQGFEEMINLDKKIPGWSMFFDANAETSHEITQDVRYFGNSSLKLIDKSNTLPIYLNSDPRPVTPGYSYQGSAMIYIAQNAGNAGGASLVLRFYDADGKQVNTDKDGENIVHLRTIGAWTRVNVTGIAPANAAYAKMGASISNYFTAASGAFYDDFTLTSPQEEKEPGTLHLQMPSGNLGSQPLEAKVMLSRGLDIQSVSGKLAFDPSDMEVAAVAVAKDFNADGTAVLDWTAEGGILKFELSAPAGTSLSGDKQVLNVTFNLLADAEKVAVTLLQGSGVQDEDGVLNNKIYVSAADETSSTHIRRASLDVNDDGQVDLYDVMAVAKLTGQMVNNNNWMFDTNNDGTIDREDVETVTNAILSKLLN